MSILYKNSFRSLFIDEEEEKKAKETKEVKEPLSMKKSEPLHTFLQDGTSKNEEEEEEEESGVGKFYINPVILHHIDISPYFDSNDIELVKIYNHLYKTNHSLKITDKGLYSISKPIDAQWITNEVAKTFPHLKKIVDGTAGIGGNTISFSRYFESVIGVEFNQVHYDVLQNNMKALRLHNVKLYHENILEYYKKIEKPEEQILFLDPPWGGKRYKQFKHFILKMGKYFIHEFIEELYQYGYRYIVLKAPLNLNVQLILQHISFQNMKIVKHSNMLLLFFF